MRRATLVILGLFMVAQSIECQELTQDEKLFTKLSEMMKVTPPTKVTVEVVPIDHLIDWYKHFVFTQCLNGLPRDPFNFSFFFCGKQRENVNVIVFGRWVEEKDPGHLHIQVIPDAGMQVKVHEYMHWVTHYRTDPVGITNSEQTVEHLTDLVLVSSEFQDWLGKQ